MLCLFHMTPCCFCIKPRLEFMVPAERASLHCERTERSTIFIASSLQRSELLVVLEERSKVRADEIWEL